MTHRFGGSGSREGHQSIGARVRSRTAVEASKPEPPAGLLPGRAPRMHQVWVVVAALLAGGGIVVSALLAGSAASADASSSRKTFDAASAKVAAALQLAIQHEEDLAVNAGAFVLGSPGASQAQFGQWAADVALLDRYPELQGLAAIVAVPAAGVPAFAALAEAGGSGPFVVQPAGERPFYCFVSLTVTRDPALSTPAGLDACAGASGSGLIDGRASGQGSYTPYASAGRTFLGIQAPLYAGGADPGTVAGREAGFVAWIGTVVDPAVLLRQALDGYPDMSVSMRYRRGESDVEFASGPPAAGSAVRTISLGGGWAVQTSGPVSSASLLADGDSRAVLAGGSAVSVLLALLVLSLGTGRERARRLVAQRTGQLHHQALHDTLTGLPNRALVVDRLEQMLVRDRRLQATGAAMFVDLDDFKNVNDTLGHAAGDQLLVAVAARLSSALREADTIGRMGGDEFVVLIDGASLEVAPELIAQRLLDVMRQPFELSATSVPLLVGISIGIASGDRATAGDLLRDADVALYQAKGAGKSRYEVFHPEMQSQISRKADLEFDLRSALGAGQFRLMYQPIYDLDDLSVRGVEALLRWDHPRHSDVTADEFVPILERTGGIRDVGRWVLSEACRQMAAWHALGHVLNLSVNVSGRQLDDDSIVADIRDALADSGLSARALIIEVTETALMRNADDTAERLHIIKDLGVRISVDDFGTGYSSLAYLRRFPADYLKIDRMFTNAITASPESKALIATLVQLGSDLGLRTIAEGVETADELDLLRSAHVDEAQGFLLAHPLDPATLQANVLNPIRPPRHEPTRPGPA
jgi:diguanylate cyclase (GGDEF)-like protein